MHVSQDIRSIVRPINAGKQFLMVEPG